MSNPVISRETSRAAEQEARQLQVAAEQAAQEAAQRKQAAQEAARVADDTRKGWEKTLASQRESMRSELSQLSAQADDLIGFKPEATRPPAEARGLARHVLRGPVQDSVRARLGVFDPTWARRNGLQETVQSFVSRGAGSFDEDLAKVADDLEVRLHRAVLERLRWLAGEAD